MNLIFETPVQYAETHAGARIYIKRDDLLPFSYGGNKLRIAVELLKDMESRGCDTVISYGSPSSNMNRVIAQLAKARRIRCHVIIKHEGMRVQGDAALDAAGLNDCDAPGVMGAAAGPSRDISCLNEQLVIWSGADITYCTSANVRETIEAVMESVRNRGGKPYYIYGDSSGQGNTAALMRAYHGVFGEIRLQEAGCGLRFDHIFIAVGTGASISGLVAARAAESGNCGTVSRMASESCLAGSGCALPGLMNPPRIHGISVARKADAERKIILDNLRNYDPELFNYGAFGSGSPDHEDPASGAPAIGSGDPADCGFDITDDYLCGGYAGMCGDIEKEITHMLRDCGVPLDPVYTGKAYYGMKQEILKKGYGGNCLFIHTGGLPLLIDHMGRCLPTAE